MYIVRIESLNGFAQVTYGPYETVCDAALAIPVIVANNGGDFSWVQIEPEEQPEGQ